MEGLAPESMGGFVSGMETRDDAGYLPFGGLLLQTVDFFPPIVDDPYRFGRIAAAVVGEVVEDAAVRVTA